MKISVLVPVYNTAAFLRQCLNSLLCQTWEELEFICIDDGSTDDSGAILDEYAKRDSRFIVCHKKNTGYGNSMNIGLSMATGEYIGILESDDFAQPDMFERLGTAAAREHPDLVKAAFYEYSGEKETRVLHDDLSQFGTETVISPREQPRIFGIHPSIWSAIYKKAFLLSNSIYFLQTPGASYQDVSFSFKIWASAERVVFLKEPVVNYRVDNIGSSINNPREKTSYLRGELREIDSFIQHRNRQRFFTADWIGRLRRLAGWEKYRQYHWMLTALDGADKAAFMEQVNPELQEIVQFWIDESLWCDWDLRNLRLMTADRLTIETRISIMATLDDFSVRIAKEHIVTSDGEPVFSLDLAEREFFGLLRQFEDISIFGTERGSISLLHYLQSRGEGSRVKRFVVPSLSEEGQEGRVEELDVVGIERLPPEVKERGQVIIPIQEEDKYDALVLLKRSHAMNVVLIEPELFEVIEREEKEMQEGSAGKLMGELSKGLMKWYPFRAGSRALCVVGNCDIQDCMADALEETGLSVCRITESELEHLGKPSGGFAYAVAVGSLEYAHDQVNMLRALREQLSPDGKLLLGTDNRLAIRYFCGDRDPFTGRSFDGIENYRLIGQVTKGTLPGRNFAKAEITEMLEQAGFPCHRFYSVFPDWKAPQILLAEDYLPRENLSLRIFPEYHHPDTVFLEEECLYPTLAQNGLLHGMANGFLVECPLDGVYLDVQQVTISMDRGPKHATATVIHRDHTVEKRPAYVECEDKLKKMMENNRYLTEHGVPMVESTLKDGAIVMPYIDAMPLTDRFRYLLQTDVPAFLSELDDYWQVIQNSSEHVPYEEINWKDFEPWHIGDTDLSRYGKAAGGFAEERETLGVILKRGYADLISVNAFYTEGGLLFFDQEFYLETFPAKAILMRTIDLIYQRCDILNTCYPKSKLWEKYRFGPYWDVYYTFNSYYLNMLRNDNLLAEYHNARRRVDQTAFNNRRRMNYTEDVYRKLFVDIFSGARNKAVYLFGSGQYARRFLERYHEFDIAAILDNNKAVQGGELHGIPIRSPSLLRELDPDSYKVIICIRYYTEVYEQVRELGASDVSIYLPQLEHTWPLRTVHTEQDSASPAKPYHLGYVAGVFDLFHVGHLNLLRRAKEQCDYLIVGVVTDEGVRRNKHTETVVPFKQRLAVVQGCRYVDEAVEIPLELCDTDTAYQKFHFDVQFSGSDYENDPIWKTKQDYLRQHGAEMIFFPYTEETSSTKIKEKLDKLP